MNVIDFKIKCNKTEDISIHPLGDLHCGTIHFAEKEFKKKVKEIYDDPLAYWIGTGDMCEYITPSDYRWDEGCVSDWVEHDNIAFSEIDYITELLKSIKDKCIGLIEGNHEDTIHKHTHVNVCKILSGKLGVPNLSCSHFVHFIFKRTVSDSRLIKGFFVHGSSNAITKGAKLNILNNLMNNFDADFYSYSHMHDIIQTSKPVLGTNNALDIIDKKKVGAVTGCWFRTYTKGKYASYGEKKLYPPTNIGSPIFKINPFKNSLWVQTNQN